MITPNVLTTAISGLKANATRVHQAANNIVNERSGDYTAGRVETVSRPTGGVDAVILGTEEPTDVATEIVNLIIAETAYKASAKLISTAEELSDTLLDITG